MFRLWVGRGVVEGWQYRAVSLVEFIVTSIMVWDNNRAQAIDLDMRCAEHALDAPDERLHSVVVMTKRLDCLKCFGLAGYEHGVRSWLLRQS